MKINKQELERLYISEGLTDREIGELFGLSDVCVSQYRRKLGISTISARNKIRKQAEATGLLDIEAVTRENFLKLYEDSGERSLAKKFGCSKQLIKTKLRELGIQALSKTERIKNSCPSKFTKEQIDLLYGSLLGDGNITKVGSSARFRESHCFAQKQYLEYKQKTLSPFSKPIRIADKEMPSGYVSRGFCFNTCFHPLFLELHNRFYFKGEKKLPEDFEKMLNPQILAIWYMDDGHLEGFEGKGQVQIASCFDSEEIGRILSVFNSWGLDSNSSFYPNKTKGINIIRVKNTDLFFALTQKYIHPNFLYKIPERLGGRWKEKLDPKDVDSWFYHLRMNGMSYPILSSESFQKEMKGLVSSTVKREGDLLDCPSVSGSKTCLSVFKNIYIAKRRGKKSAVDVFEDDNLLMHSLRDCVKYYGEINETNLRQELRSFGGVNNFKPVLAKYIYNSYCQNGGKVLDPCSGWGGRLCGFMASIAGSYTGIDVEHNSIENLKRLFRKMNPVFPGKTFYCQEQSFTDFCGNGYDFVFTSPPYYDTEYYGESCLQSQNMFNSYDLWIEGFLKVLVEKSWKALNASGRLALNIPAKCRYPIYEDLKTFMPISEELKIKTNGRYGSRSGFEYLLVSPLKTISCDY